MSKDRYVQFCRETYVPVFSQPWWLDAVCGEANWDVFVLERGGNLIAAMPYYIKIENGEEIITRAKLTQNNGIIIKYPKAQKYCSKLEFEEKIINEICDMIAALRIKKYEQQYHYSFDNWLPFFWQGYTSTVRYTYVIEDTSDLSNIENQFSANARNMVRKARKEVVLTDAIDLDAFYLLNKLTFERQGLSIPFSLSLVQNIYHACTARNCCRLIAAEDTAGNLHSAALLVWDEQSVYFLINGTNPLYKSSQANSLIIYEGIKTASQLEKKFDFEGSVIQPIEKAFRQYGGIRKPYFRITREFDR